MKVACGIIGLASEGDFGTLFTKEGSDLAIGDIADLVIVVDNLAVLVAHSAISCLHQGVASLIFGADIAVNTRPTFVAIARLAGAHGSIFTAGQRTANLSSSQLPARIRIIITLTRFQAIVAAKTFGAVAFAVELIAARVLSAGMGW